MASHAYRSWGVPQTKKPVYQSFFAGFNDPTGLSSEHFAHPELLMRDAELNVSISALEALKDRRTSAFDITRITQLTPH